MADQKLSELDSASTVGSTDLLYLVQGNSSKKISVSSLLVLAKILAMNSSGNVVLANNAKINITDPGNIDLIAGDDNSWAELQSFNGETYVWVDNNTVHIATGWNTAAREWLFTSSGTVIHPWNPTAVPQYTTSVGTQGTWAYDSSAVYVCVATNTWKRALLQDW